MATKLPKFDFDMPSNLTTSEKATYPWEDWFDGDIWQIQVDDDFDPHPLMMERIIRTRATGRGARVQLRHQPTNGGVHRFDVSIQADSPEAAEKKLTKLLERETGTSFKPSPFGVIVFERVDVKGPAALKKAEQAAKRQAKRANAEKAAAETLAKAGIKRTPAVKAAAKPRKAVSKTPSKKTPAKVA